MKISDYLGILGGLALFFYGMKMMSDGLEESAEHRIKQILERLTNHKLKAIMVGIIITSLIQSSSAMTVMLIGLVNANVIELKQAVWVVMGANIGTTITGQMLALDIGMIAPILAIIGVILIVLSSQNLWGEIIGGIGLLFMGLEMMSVSLTPLQHSLFFRNYMTSLTNPFLCVLIGMLLTAVIQSSSASIGILQTFAAKKLIPFSTTVYFIFGFDIGTCITAFLASLTGCLNAKRLALFHILLNIIGTLFFMGICSYSPLVSFIENLTPSSIMHQIANMHTLFNIVTTLLIVCMDKYLLKVVCTILT